MEASFKCEICQTNPNKFYMFKNDDTVYCGYCFKKAKKKIKDLRMMVIE